MTNLAQVRYTKYITKIYPNKYQHTTLKHPVISDAQNLGKPPEQIKKSKKDQAKTEEENLERSLRRTQKELSDLIDCNPFEWFGTFTFDPKKIDRHDSETVKKAMTKWLNNQRRHSPDMTYILVPERHKDGAIHFHALLGNFNGKMAESGSKWQGEPIFNVLSYKLGFTNFTKIRNKSKTSNYCRKYITKDMASTDSGKRRYWRSKNLKIPEKVYNQNLVKLLQSDSRIDTENVQTYENDHVSIVFFPLKA